MPAEMDWKVRSVRTGVGSLRSVAVLSPSSPTEFEPQQSASPDPVRAQAWSVPTDTEA